MVTPSIGVLALQGDWDAHLRVLARLGGGARAVRTAAELAAVHALVLPGGESTAMLRLMEKQRLASALRERMRQGMPVLATCAGVILVACSVVPQQPSLGVLDIDVQRNAYGRQLDSKIVPLRLVPELGEPRQLEGVFIRAPRIERVGKPVTVLAWRGDDPVLVQQAGILAATFHPELTNDSRVHQRFLDMIATSHDVSRRCDEPS